MTSRTGKMRIKVKAFSFVELLVAVAVISIGMVFVLGAFSQCLSVSGTAKKMITASYLLNAKMWEIGLAYEENEGSIEGEWEESLESPYEGFVITQAVEEFSHQEAFNDNEALIMEEEFYEEAVQVAWRQNNKDKNVFIRRYVKKAEGELF